ncbi:hypothetical protein CCACVL1_14141 [Corchorus capsularis]|uniref:Uncharacterized protein n=1 Tax=Corchorus capsularis TaxID=210143 RepID=A0A1R3I824_COCAP|nr:hypothetical protein CCACVL1_14141 [Corchorus capsularis]
MEEPKAAQNPPSVQDPNPPTASVTDTATQTAPPPPQQEPPRPPAAAPPSTAPEQPANKKRPLENRNDQSQNSKYVKMRLILKDLRPHFIEVLRTPDFRNCKAANEIKEQIKLLLELHGQITAETVSAEKCNNAPGNQSLTGQTDKKQKPEQQPQAVKPAVSSENKGFQLSSVSVKQQSEDGEAPGTYIVGGSAFGWNFITFTGNTPVYYGVTKEAFRISQATLGGE